MSLFNLGGGSAAPEKPEGTAVLPQHAQDSVQIRPSISEAKATAQAVGSLQPGRNKGGRPRKDGLPPGTVKPGAVLPAPVESLPPPFTWNAKDIAILGDAPFDVAYIIGGPDHEHWLKARDEIQKSGCYDKFAYVANRLGWKDPIYLVLAVGMVQYSTVIAKCGRASFAIRKEKLEALSREKPKAQHGD